MRGSHAKESKQRRRDTRNRGREREGERGRHRTRRQYSKKTKRKVVDKYLSGVPDKELTQEFGPCRETIFKWVADAAKSSKSTLKGVLRLAGWGFRLWRNRELILKALYKVLCWAKAHPAWAATAAAVAAIGLAIAALRRFRRADPAFA